MDENWNKNKLVGNIAESIVEMLINSMPDWNCCKFGVENHIIDIKDMVRGVINPLTNKIRKMPDFLAFNKETKKTLLIEVKYSSNAQRKGYLFPYLEEYEKYWNGTKLIIVHPNEPHFVYIDLEKVIPSMKTSRNVDINKYIHTWDFTEIEQDIKDLFPDLKDEDLKEAKKIFNLKNSL